MKLVLFPWPITPYHRSLKLMYRQESNLLFRYDNKSTQITMEKMLRVLTENNVLAKCLVFNIS